MTYRSDHNKLAYKNTFDINRLPSYIFNSFDKYDDEYIFFFKTASDFYRKNHIEYCCRIVFISSASHSIYDVGQR